MKTLVVHVTNSQHVEQFEKAAKKANVQLVFVTEQYDLFNKISVGNADGYIMSSDLTYSQRAVNSIRSLDVTVPIVSIGECQEVDDLLDNVDLNYPLWTKGTPLRTSHAYSIIRFCMSQSRLYEKLEMTKKPKERNIFFGVGYRYDTDYRILYRNEVKVCTLSLKCGRIMEMFAGNYKKILKREVILEDIWKKSDIYTSRSFDVYVSNMRSLFKENNLDLKIVNIPGTGLIME